MEPSRILWQKDGVFAAKRIPGILLTPAGTVLWWCEARDTLSDWARIDLQLYRSEDGGKSFSEPLTLASGDAEHPTVNNPVLIAARDGTLFFLYCRDYSVDGGDVFLRVSRDDGRTWTEPRDLMSSTRPAEHNAFAFGPGHGIETPDGTLLCPVWYVKKSAGMEPRSHHPAVVSSFFSRDGGGSWTLGEEIPATADCPDPNETAAAILSDGSGSPRRDALHDRDERLLPPLPDPRNARPHLHGERDLLVDRRAARADLLQLRVPDRAEAPHPPRLLRRRADLAEFPRDRAGGRRVFRSRADPRG